MIFVSCLLFLALFVVVIILKQYYLAIIFCFKKQKKQKTKDCVKRKKELAVLKKPYILSRKKFLFSIQTKSFYGKFLYQKEFSNLSNKKKFFIDNIYKKISNNTTLLNTNVDFNKLKCAGFNLNLPIFLIKPLQLKEELSFYEEAVKILSKKVNFQPIFIFNNNNETFSTIHKTIFLDDFNLKLFNELNKLNINYNPLFNFNPPHTQTDYFSNIDLQITRTINFANNKNISYRIMPKENGKIIIFLKQDCFYYNVYLKNNSLEIVSSKNEKTIYTSNRKINKVYKTNKNGTSFLCVEFVANKSKGIIFLNSKNIDNYKNELLIEKIEKNNLFNLKIYTKNKKFNDFFNVFLPKKIIEELYQKNYIKIQQIKFNKMFLCEFLDINYKEVVENSKSYFQLYNYILKDVFGINKDDKRILINSKKVKFNYKICVNYQGINKQIYVKEHDEKNFGNNTMVLSNVSSISLESINKPVVVCC